MLKEGRERGALSPLPFPFHATANNQIERDAANRRASTYVGRKRCTFFSFLRLPIIKDDSWVPEGRRFVCPSCFLLCSTDSVHNSVRYIRNSPPPNPSSRTHARGSVFNGLLEPRFTGRNLNFQKVVVAYLHPRQLINTPFFLLLHCVSLVLDYVYGIIDHPAKLVRHIQSTRKKRASFNARLYLHTNCPS